MKTNEQEKKLKYRIIKDIIFIILGIVFLLISIFKAKNKINKNNNKNNIITIINKK